jgi:hypothetical protein
MVDAEKKTQKLYTESFFICIFAPIIVYWLMQFKNTQNYGNRRQVA